MLGKKYFKLNYIVTIVLLVLTLALSFSFTSNNFTTQDGIEESTAAPTTTSGSWTSSSSRYATSFAGGNGTWGMPWQISTAAQLARMSYLVNNSNSSYGSDTFELTANIDLSQYYWSPIGTESYPFTGDFKCNNYKISGLYTRNGSSASYDYQGLFGYISDASLYNIVIKNSYIQGHDYVGGIVGYKYMSKVENSYYEGNVSGNTYVGGIVGYNHPYSSKNTKSLVSYCFNAGNVSGNEYVGGVVGYSRGGRYYKSDTDLGIIEYCYNKGQVSGNTSVGGLTGYNFGAKIMRSFNIGTVNGTSQVGGLAGRSSGMDGTNSAKFFDSYNKGNITGTNYVGGIVGYNDGNNYGSYLLTLYNTGSVKGSTYVGGIIGYDTSSGHIYNSLNVGSVSGSSYRGGIIGYLDSSGREYVTDCYYGGNCTLTIGVGGYTSQTNPNENTIRYSNLNSTTYAKNQDWYTNETYFTNYTPSMTGDSKSAAWNFTRIWAINSNINEGYPYLRELIYSIEYVCETGTVSADSPTFGYPEESINIANPESPIGYTFAGWTAEGLNTNIARHGTNSSTSSYWANESTKVTSTFFKNLTNMGATVTLIANYEVSSYNISYNNVSSHGFWGNGASHPNQVNYETAFNVSNPTADNAYEFTGWTSSTSVGLGSNAQSGTSTSSLSSWNGSSTKNTYFRNLNSSSGTVTLTANYSPISYKLKLVENGGSGVSDLSYTIESTSTLPTISRTGYNFNKWKVTTADGNWSSNSTHDIGKSVKGMYGNATLTAQWTKESYTIKYDANGGSVSPTSDSVNYNERITLPTPTRTGYTFIGWEYDGNTYSGSYIVPDFGNNGATVTFTAQWSQERYTINYNANSGSVSPTSDSVNYGESITLPTPTRTGYTFNGWRYGGTNYTGSYTVPDFGDNGATVTFTAQWTIEKYTINYNANGGSVSPNSQTVNYGASITLPTPTPPGGYYFTGWSYGGRTYTGSYTVPDFGNNGASVTFTAQWTANKYTIIFDEVGGSEVSDIVDYTIESTISFPSTTKAGYDFVNWQVTRADGNWTNGATFNANTTTTDKYGNVTLTAQWNYHTYTVTLDPNGGEVSPTSIRVTYQSTYGSLPTPTRDGYVFKGWYTSETSGTQILSTTKYTSTQDTTIYAQWQDTWANHASDALTSENGYYLVSSEEDLARVSYLLNCTTRTDVQTMKFKLTKNLDMSDYTWLPIGSQSRQFRGTFEGNGYIISGLNTYYNSSISSTYTNIGLFGYVNGATIQNLYLRDTDMRGGSNVGGLIGYATGNTQVTSCAFDGDITANSNGGSIVGLGATSVIVSNCTVFSSNTTANTNGMARGCSVRSLVYITNGTKGYIGTDFSNYVFVEGMPAPVPTGLSWLAQGGEPCDLADIEEWAEN